MSLTVLMTKNDLILNAIYMSQPVHAFNARSAPEFQLIATREQARDRLNGTFQHVPVEFAIASQLDDYRKKIKQVAEEHPEFLQAVIEYTEKRQEYIEATGWVSKESE